MDGIECGYRQASECPYFTFYKELEERFTDKYNSGDWTMLDTVEIGDTVGGVKVINILQKEIIVNAGRQLKTLEENGYNCLLPQNGTKETS